MTGFNANIDRVISLTPALLRSFEQHAAPEFDAILPRMKQSMRHCSADEVFISEPSMYRTLLGSFSRSGTLSVGGQAGIAAVHLHRLGVQQVTCAVPAAGIKTCALLQNAGIITLTFASEADARPDVIHLIFEYSPDLVPPAGHVVPRSNRFIVSPLHDSSSVIIPDAFLKSFLEQIASCRRAFLSGYQYLRTDREFKTAATQIQMIRGVHPLMRTHVECVSVSDPGVMSMMLRYILPYTDSIGLNERELGLFMHALRAADSVSAAELPVSPASLVRDAVAFADATGISRVHLHTFGYYILVLKSETSQPEVSRNALLFAARAAAIAAGGSEQILSREGLLAYSSVRNVFGPDITPGIFMYDDWVMVIVPTYISQNIQKTTGLGDILSSTAFVADRF